MLFTSLILSLFLNFSWAQGPLLQTERVPVPWAVTDWEPFYIRQGSNANMGRVDRIRKLLQENLPGYNWTDVNADMPKTMDLWRRNKNICSGSALKTPEREKLAFFTALSYQVQHEYVLVTSNSKMLESLPKEVSLAEIIKNKKWHGVFVRDRSYGDQIDGLLKEVSARDTHLTLKKNVEGYAALLKMLEKQRFDYLIEYASVVRMHNEKIFPDKPLATRVIKESHPAVVFYMACTKNSWGRDVVQTVDKLMQRLATTPEYHMAVESWLDPTLVKKNQKLLEEFYKKRSQGPWLTVPEN